MAKKRISILNSSNDKVANVRLEYVYECCHNHIGHSPCTLNVFFLYLFVLSITYFTIIKFCSFFVLFLVG